MKLRGSKAELEVRRRSAIVLLQGGLGVCEVASRIGVMPSSVSRWWKLFRQGGEDALRPKRWPGSKPRLSDAQRSRLGKLLLRGPRAHGYSTELWTLQRVAEVIEKEFSVHYNVSHVWRVLQRMNWSCQKPERRARERDEDSISRWREATWPRLKNGEEAAAKPRLH